MRTPLIRSVLGGAAIAAVAAIMPVTGAHAQVRCLSDGYQWHCQDGSFVTVSPAPAWGYQPTWDNNYYGDYNDIPNDYPGPSPVYNNRY